MSLKKELILKSHAKEEQLKKVMLEKCPILYWAKEYHVNTRGERLDFSNMPYLIPIYVNFSKWTHLVVEKCVQIGLSELFIVASFYEAAVLGLTVFYVLPKYESRNRFVSNRVDKVIRKVAKYAHLVKQSDGANRLALKHFGNGTIAYVGSNVEEEFVEIPVDSAFIDEKDRCNATNLLMVPDRLTASPYKHYREISNPTIEGFGIDERYLESSRALWFIKCDSCGTRFSPDFFQHVVKQVDTDRWESRWKDYKYDQNTDSYVICPKCNRPVDRLGKGEWVDEFTNKEWKGLRVSKIYNKNVHLGKLIDKWIKIFPHPLKRQIFFNSDLGLPFTSKGSKLDDVTLSSCERGYVYPVEKKNVKGTLIMGVDVGSSLHVVVRERVKDDSNCWIRKLVLIIALPSFKLLANLIKELNPRIVVIDAQPEIHEVMSLKETFKQVYSCRFSHDQLKLNISKSERILSIDRTCILDGVKKEFDDERIINPIGGKDLDGGNYYSHLKASTRLLMINEKNPEKSYYSWEHSSPDHYFLSEAYCLLGDIIVPRDSVLDFYNSFLSDIAVTQEQEKRQLLDQTNITESSLNDLKNITPQSFLNNLRKK